MVPTGMMHLQRFGPTPQCQGICHGEYNDLTTMTERETAYHIAEEILAKTGTAIMKGDFDAFGRWFTVPMTTESFDGQRRVESLTDLRAVFDGAFRFYNLLNVTDLIRHVITAEFAADGTLHTVHEARLLSYQIMLEQKTTCFSRMRRIDGSWKIDLTRYANTRAPQLDAVLSGANHAGSTH